MKRLMAVLMALLLAGCGPAGQIEGQAFCVSLAVDAGESGGIVLSARYPSYGANGKDEKSDYLLTAAAGPDFASALYALNAAIPRALNLTQVKSLIVSEKIASSAGFFSLLRDMKLSRLDGEANLIVCGGEARSLLEAQQPLIGLRLSDTLVTEIERYRRLGIVPGGTLQRVFYDAASVYSDPVTTYAAARPKEEKAESNPPAPEAEAGALEYEGENRDEYFGAALFRGGAMAGTLGGGETQILRLIRDGATGLPMAMNGALLTVSRRGALRVEVDFEAGWISVSLKVGLEDPRGDAEEAAVAKTLSDGLDALTKKCQALGVEPFGYARFAAARFPALSDWTDLDWRAWFAAAAVEYRVRVEKINR